MRIDKSSSDVDAIGTVRTEAASAEAASQTRGTAPAPVADQVEVSSTAALASQAIKAAESAPDIRPDVVARAKALLDSGALGSDPYRLADALIERTLAKD